jgi:hypothetical protein
MERSLTLKMAVVGSMIPVIIETQRSIKEFARESEWNLKKVTAGVRAVGTAMVGLAVMGVAAMMKFDETMKNLRNITHMTYKQQMEFAESARQTAVSVGLQRDEIIDAATAYVSFGGAMDDYKNIQHDFGVVLSASGASAESFGEQLAKLQIVSKYTAQSTIDMMKSLYDFGNKGLGPTLNKFLENNDLSKEAVNFLSTSPNAKPEDMLKYFEFLMVSYEGMNLSRMMTRLAIKPNWKAENAEWGMNIHEGMQPAEILNQLYQSFTKRGMDDQQKKSVLMHMLRMETGEADRVIEVWDKLDEKIKQTNKDAADNQAAKNAATVSNLIHGISDALMTGFQKGLIDVLFAGKSPDEIQAEIAKITEAFVNLGEALGVIAGIMIEIIKNREWLPLITGVAAGLATLSTTGNPYAALAAALGVGAVTEGGVRHMAWREGIDKGVMSDAKKYILEHPNKTGVKDLDVNNDVSIRNYTHVYLNGQEVPIEKIESKTEKSTGTSNQREEPRSNTGRGRQY